jgi:flagellar basal-body rod protein FlgG
MKMVDVITNNLANAQTAGFKRDFSQILQNETGYDVGTSIDLSEGDLVTTGNDLDVALNGPGFFALETPAGTRYTRSGALSLSAEGTLVLKDGSKVLSNSGSPIVLGPGTVSINDAGVISLDGNEVATLKIVEFREPGKLEKEGLYRLVWRGGPEGVEDAADPRVKSGHLERSNVNAVNEMVHLMSAYREFEAVQRTLKTLMTDMNGHLIQELGRLS